MENLFKQGSCSGQDNVLLRNTLPIMRRCECFRKHMTASVMIVMAMMAVKSMSFVRKSSILNLKVRMSLQRAGKTGKAVCILFCLHTTSYFEKAA